MPKQVHRIDEFPEAVKAFGKLIPFVTDLKASVYNGIEIDNKLCHSAMSGKDTMSISLMVKHEKSSTPLIISIRGTKDTAAINTDGELICVPHEIIKRLSVGYELLLRVSPSVSKSYLMVTLKTAKGYTVNGKVSLTEFKRVTGLSGAVNQLVTVDIAEYI